MTHLLYLHGFASSAGGQKPDYLRSQLARRPDVTFHALDFSPTPADFAYLTVTGMINRLRPYILDRDLTTFALIGAAHLLLLSSTLIYLSGKRVGLPLSEWQAKGVGEVFHYGFNRPVSLRRPTTTRFTH